MILSSVSEGVKIFGFLVPIFGKRGWLPKDYSEDVAVSIILDEWCTRSGKKRSDPATDATLRRILELRAWIHFRDRSIRITSLTALKELRCRHSTGTCNVNRSSSDVCNLAA